MKSDILRAEIPLATWVSAVEDVSGPADFRCDYIVVQCGRNLQRACSKLEGYHKVACRTKQAQVTGNVYFSGVYLYLYMYIHTHFSFVFCFTKHWELLCYDLDLVGYLEHIVAYTMDTQEAGALRSTANCCPPPFGGHDGLFRHKATVPSCSIFCERCEPIWREQTLITLHLPLHSATNSISPFQPSLSHILQ